MALSPLAPVSDYQSMLSRVFWFTSVAALGVVWLLRENVPAIELQLSQLDSVLHSGSGELLPIPAGTLLPALAIGLLARVFRLHGHLAHWLGVRERFDIDVIIDALAREADVDVDQVADEQWVARRHDIMRQAFYRFAGNNSLEIDPHLVHQALDSWSWFWIGLEAATVFVLAGFALIAGGSYAVGLATLGISLATAGIGLPLIRLQCKRFALAQVRAIVSDPERLELVRQAFAGLPSRELYVRRAA